MKTFIALVLLSATALAAQIAGTRIPLRGHLVVPGVMDVNHIEVRLINQSGVVVARAYTNSDGEFELNGGVGTFFVESSLEGFETIHERVEVINNAGGSAAIVTLAFTRNISVGAAPDPDSIDRTKWPKKVLDEYDKALQDSEKGNAAKAKERLEAVIKQAPDFYNAHNALGEVYQALKNTVEADREYRKARELNPKSTKPLVNLGSLYIQFAEQRISDGPAALQPLVEAAAAFLQEAVRINPQSAAGYALLGTLAYRTGNLQVAEEDLTHALRLNPHLGSAMLTLANVYTRQQKWDNTVKILDAYLEDNPKASNKEQIQQARARAVQSMQTVPGQR